jgi:hypothetical protein
MSQAVECLPSNLVQTLVPKNKLPSHKRYAGTLKAHCQMKEASLKKPHTGGVHLMTFWKRLSAVGAQEEKRDG